MSSPSAADGLAAWEHGLTPVVLKRLRTLIRPFDTPTILAFDPERYARLYNSSSGHWGDVLARYALFQRLRRRGGETEADHRIRQNRWLAERRKWEQRTFLLGGHDVRTMPPDDPDNGPSIALGTSIASPEQIAGSELEYTVPISATGRVLVLDIASDKDRLMARISELIDHEREAAGVATASRRGRKTRADQNNSEYREFLKSLREHHVVPLWDLQLAGLAMNELASARVLYPELHDPARNVSRRSIPRVLLQKIERARKLQDQVISWVFRLRTFVG
jgi:hypothetical protein